MRVSSEFQVNLAHLDYNFLELKKLAPSNEVIFMVKGNGYGHGILEISSFAVNELGIKRLGCASLGEALYIRRNLPKLTCELWVFSDLNLEDRIAIQAYTELGIYPVISHFKDLIFFLNQKKFSNIPLILKIDTGMHRLGIAEGDLESLSDILKKAGRHTIHHLMTHFANSYLKLKENDRTSRQYRSFKKAMGFLNSKGIEICETSVSNSGALEQKFGLEESHIRPGLMLYGPSSCYKINALWKGKNLSRLKTEIIKIMPIKKGMPIGYGSFICGKDGFGVYLPIGYADGILTYYSGHKFISYDKETEILGRVNMDMICLYFSSLPKGFEKGKDFFLWNWETNLTEFSSILKTTPYQVLTAITGRIPKRYLNKNI